MKHMTIFLIALTDIKLAIISRDIKQRLSGVKDQLLGPDVCH